MTMLINAIYNSNLERRNESSDGFFRVGFNVKDIFCSMDHKIEFLVFDESRCLAGVVDIKKSVTYYKLKEVFIGSKINAVLMDLDGTSADSEDFWIEIIRLVVSQIISDAQFVFEEVDFPFISGHSVSEHLGYCIHKYCKDSYSLVSAINIYHNIVDKKMTALMSGKIDDISFNPSQGLKNALLFFKENSIKIGLVTSGSYSKAYPEITSIFTKIGLGEPSKFYDSIITAGTSLKKNYYGTLGELSAKPHPWLYSETCQIGLGINPDDYHDVIGIEDSGAGVCALRLAGIPVIGLKNGNIIKSGYQFLCEYMADGLDDAVRFIKNYV